MRTTIEITAEQREQLMAIAARRGEKGFSKLVQQALDAFLKVRSRDAERRRRAVMLKGALREPDAERLRDATHRIRESWR